MSFAPSIVKTVHREKTATKLIALHAEIIQNMNNVKETFVSENPDVQAHWLS